MTSRNKLSLSSLLSRRKKLIDDLPPPNFETLSNSDKERPSKITERRRLRHRERKTSPTCSENTALSSVATGDLGNKVDQDVVANGSITKATVENVQTQQSLNPEAPSADFWNRAYQLLREDQSQKSSLDKYEHILALEFGDQYQSPTGSGGLTSSNTEMLSGLVAKKLGKMEDERWRIKVQDTSIELRPQFDRFINAVIAVKDFVSAAVSSEPHATLAWAGICIVLPLLTNPTTQQKALVEGVDHISTVIVRFAVLDRFYHSRTPSPTKKDIIDLMNLFETQTIKLYSQILSYQAHVICQLARATALQASRDVIKIDDCAVKITEIKASEAASLETFRLLGLETANRALEDQGLHMQFALKDHRQHMDELFKQLQTKSSNEKVQKSAWEQTAEESKCLQALCKNASTYEDTKNRNRQRVPDTCRWFLDSQKFQKWREEESTALLWVTADPGCGKSVLSKSLVDDELKSTETSTTAYFFFKTDNPDTRSITSAISALLHQLGIQRSTLLSTIVAQYHTKGDQMLRSFSWLWNLLLETIRRPEAGEIVCVLDALDECEETERALLVDALNSLRQGGHGQLKFLVTSRPYFDLEELFDKSTPRLAGENESSKLKNEIDLVIKGKIANIAKRKILNQRTRDRLEERLIETKHRTYLWLHLVLPNLEKALIRNPSDVDHIMNQVSSLDDAYEAILNHSPHPEQAQRLLHIIVAAVRPLKIHEINIALNIKRGNKCLEATDLDPEDALISNIKNICGLFVTVHKSRIYLLHQTAKEFLVHPSCPETSLHRSSPSVIQGDTNFDRLPQRYLENNAMNENTVSGHTTPKRSQPLTTVTSDVRTWKFSLDPVESHHVLAEICLAYLLFDFMDEPIEIMYDCWSSYSAMSSDAVEVRSISLSDDLENGYYPDFSNSGHGSLSTRSGSSRLYRIHDPTSSGPAPQEALYGSEKRKDPSGINAPSARSERVDMDQRLHFPSGGSVSDDAPELLKDFNNSAAFVSEGQGSMPFPPRSRTPRERRTRDLFSTRLSARQDLLQYASRNWALHYEAARQDNNLRAMWLSFCIPGSPKFEIWNSLQRFHVTLVPTNVSQLALACCFGHNRTIAHLLRENNDIESRDLHGCTPLIWAIKRGNETTVDFLLANGALINSIEVWGRTPLWFAAKYAEDKIAEKLICGGAFLNPESKLESPEGYLSSGDWGSAWSSPLAVAVTELGRHPRVKEISYLNVIRLLLDRGAVVDLGTKTASPLKLAIKGLNKHSSAQELIAKLLLGRGADVNFQDTEFGETPLHKAVALRATPMIELILEEKPKLEVQNFFGETPLHMLLHGVHTDSIGTIARMLLGAGADPNATGSRHGTPLFCAVDRFLMMVLELLKANSDPSIFCDERMALDPDVWRAELECVELFLTAGVDANTKNLADRTLDVAQMALAYKQNSTDPREMLFRPRDLEALMKLLRPFTRECEDPREFAPRSQSSERDSNPDPLPIHPANDPGLKLTESKTSSPSIKSRSSLSVHEENRTTKTT